MLAVYAVTGAASDRLSVTSRLVMVPVTVTDTKGRAILGLDREHFQVTEDAESREIVSLTREDGAAAVGIVLDLSGSMRSAARQALDAARAISATANEGDEAFLMTFSDRPELRVPLTRDPAAIGRGLAHVRTHGGTALVDAIWQGLEQARRSAHPRRSLVAISDGGENASRHRIAELKRFAIEADTRIHSIAIQRPYRKGDPPGRPWMLEELAEVTGGLHFVIHDGYGLAEAAGKLARAMKEVYVLAYRPAASDPGRWRKVRVSVTPPERQRIRVAARSGYYYPED
jgi:Ca-activated chloride channel family protein